MKKIRFAVLSMLIVLAACSKDDNKTEKPRDRAQEAIEAQNEIEEYLNNYTYNYEDFDNPSEDFDFKIQFEKIEESGKTPLMDLVDYKVVEDPVKAGLEYKLYYLKVKKGDGEALADAEVAFITYDIWRMRTDELIDGTSDSQPKPFVMDAPSNPGLKEVLREFNAGTDFEINDDGTVTYTGYGIGAAFIPSGLAFFNQPPLGSTIGYYNQLIYTFHTKAMKAKESDEDEDNADE